MSETWWTRERMIHQAEELLIPLRKIVVRGDHAETIAFVMYDREGGGGIFPVIPASDVPPIEFTLVVEVESHRLKANGVILVEERGDRARLVLQTEDGLGMVWTAPIGGDGSLGEWEMVEDMEAAVEFYGRFVIPRSLPEKDEEVQ